MGGIKPCLLLLLQIFFIIVKNFGGLHPLVIHGAYTSFYAIYNDILNFQHKKVNAQYYEKF